MTPKKPVDQSVSKKNQSVQVSNVAEGPTDIKIELTIEFGVQF